MTNTHSTNQYTATPALQSVRVNAALRTLAAIEALRAAKSGKVAG